MSEPRRSAVDASRIRPEDVRIVVVNWRRPTETLECLASLAEAGIDEAAVLVVDNGSRDESIARIRSAFPRVGLIDLAQNMGFAGGANAGIRRALEEGAEAVFLLNNDAFVATDFLPPLLDAIGEEDVAAVCSAVFRADVPELMDFAYADVDLGSRNPVQVRGVNALPSAGYDRRCEVGSVIGCALLMRAAAIRRVGAFDESYFAYHEDVDWSLRARQSGYRLLFEPYSRVFHHGEASSGGRWSQARGLPPPPREGHLPGTEPLPCNPVRAYLGGRNLVRLVGRHGDRSQKARFLRACLRELPLEFLAAVMNRTGWHRLGRFRYADAMRFHLDTHYPAWRAARSGPSRVAITALLVVPAILWSLPAEVVAAARSGRLAEWAASVRGLGDGVLRRPVPLERLGLR